MVTRNSQVEAVHAAKRPSRRDFLDLSSILQYGKIVTKLGYDARFQDFKVQNIVGSTDVKFPIRLEGLAYSHAVFASVRSPSPFPDSLEQLTAWEMMHLHTCLSFSRDGQSLLTLPVHISSWTSSAVTSSLQKHAQPLCDCSMSQSCSQDSSIA